MTSASTGSAWDEDEEECVKKKISELKRYFHNGRQLQIKHLPRDVTEEDIRDLLPEFSILSVHLLPSLNSAFVALEDPEMLEDWVKEKGDKGYYLHGQRVSVGLTPTDMMLCVAKLPFDYTEEEFTSLVEMYGEVKCSFLMISEQSGDSKGYGIVEYTAKEVALQAKNLLDGKQIRDNFLLCEWLDPHHVTFDSLHSKCLYVDKLPNDYRDMGEFRKIFSTVVNPPYCQIALKNGAPQDWGLVEFTTAAEAESTQVMMNGYRLHGHRIRVFYGIPGVRAINIYMKLLNDQGSKANKTSALLPDPPAPAVFQQLQNLAKQNPVFASNLQNIILTQIQSLQEGSDPAQEGQKKAVPPPRSSESKTFLSTPQPNGNSLAINASTNAQAALVILLASQLQMQMGNTQPSLLGNPQMLTLLQNLVKHGGTADLNNPLSSGALNNLLSLSSTPGTAVSQLGPGGTMQVPFCQNQNGSKELMNISPKNGFRNGYQKLLRLGPPPKVPLLPSPCPSPSGSEANGRPLPPQTSWEEPPPVINGSLLPGQVSGTAQDSVPSLWTGFGQPVLPASLPEAGSHIKNGHYENCTNVFQKTPLLGTKPNSFPSVRLPFTKPPPAVPASVPVSVSSGQINGDLQQTINVLLSNAQNLNQVLGSLTSAIQRPDDTQNGNTGGAPCGKFYLPAATPAPALTTPGTPHPGLGGQVAPPVTNNQVSPPLQGLTLNPLMNMLLQAVQGKISPNGTEIGQQLAWISNGTAEEPLNMLCPPKGPMLGDCPPPNRAVSAAVAAVAGKPIVGSPASIMRLTKGFTVPPPVTQLSGITPTTPTSSRPGAVLNKRQVLGAAYPNTFPNMLSSNAGVAISNAGVTGHNIISNNIAPGPSVMGNSIPPGANVIGNSIPPVASVIGNNIPSVANVIGNTLPPGAGMISNGIPPGPTVISPRMPPSPNVINNSVTSPQTQAVLRAYQQNGLIAGFLTQQASNLGVVNAVNVVGTPIGLKRKYNHIPPSPEVSPEGPYIGQHSQGLGGHYADSYFKRKKLN